MSKKILLIGNAPFYNRGCEAIVRGTVSLLEQEYPNSTYITASFGDAPAIELQAKEETDTRITHRLIEPIRRYSLRYFRYQLSKRLGLGPKVCTQVLPEEAFSCDFALQVGGDNYSLEYGRPYHYLEVDEELNRRGIPLYLWGASVGPFTKDPEFEKIAAKHFKMFRRLYVREERSFNYLKGLGLDNVFQCADPAFHMTPLATGVAAAAPGTIGLNFSPLGFNVANADEFSAYAKKVAAVVDSIAASYSQPVLLIPHVVIPSTENDDRLFLKEVYKYVTSTAKVSILEGNLSARQLKYVISSLDVFMGARTHATIAALSTGVPTLSLAYSVKAWGINEQIFGHHQYCIPVGDVLKPAFPGTFDEFYQNRGSIRNVLTQNLPRIKNLSQAAAKDLKAIAG